MDNVHFRALYWNDLMLMIVIRCANSTFTLNLNITHVQCIRLEYCIFILFF